jgi:diaminohydroxyphosphoribosylaminopyrimidine deaminase/5-amino-6-(5-phosphoribosylamino)uracil reductase
MNHDFFMKRCFDLARLGMGRVSPNPMVGAILVKNNRIIGEGFHQIYGGPHAEVNCFENCTESPEGATLYVNLEPCCHKDKITPPCTPLVIQKKVKQVFISNIDPNPKVSGLGIQALREAGIEVQTGLLEKEGSQLNEIFFHWIKNQTPFVHIKSAMTVDGKIAHSSGTSQWITSEASRLDSHWGRLQYDALMVGAETLRKDNPSLTIRIPGHQLQRAPYRIVLTVSGHLPSGAKLFNDENKQRTLVVTGRGVQVPLPEDQIIRLSSLGPLNFDELYFEFLQRKITSLWIEGGAGIQSLFLTRKQAQRLTLYVAPKLMGSGLSVFQGDLAPDLAHLPTMQNVEMTFKGQDLKVTGLIHYPA